MSSHEHQIPINMINASLPINQFHLQWFIGTDELSSVLNTCQKVWQFLTISSHFLKCGVKKKSSLVTFKKTKIHRIGGGKNYFGLKYSVKNML